MQRHLLIVYLALQLVALNVAPISSARSDGNKEISPIFRRKPYKSTTESSSSTTSTERETEQSSDSSGTTDREDRNKFRVGAEHYYDNRIDIQKQNDDLDIEIDEEEDGTNYDGISSTEYSEYSDEEDEEQYYYEDYVEGDPVEIVPDPTKPSPTEYKTVAKPKQKYRLQRLERLKLVSQNMTFLILVDQMLL